MDSADLLISLGLERYGLASPIEIGGKVMAEYIYIVDGVELQSKTVILEGGRPQSADALPPLELRTELGEVYLQPRSIYPDPLRGGEHVLVLCDAHVPPQLGAGELHPRPHAANTRAACAEVAAAAAAAGAAPLFTVEQEYSVLDPFTGLPPGVFAAGVPIYAPGAAQPRRSCESDSPWGSPCCGAAGGGPLASGSPGSGASCGGALAASLPCAAPGCGCCCGGGGGGAGAAAAAAAARLLLQAHAQPQHPRGSPAARRARQLSELHMRACIKAGLRYAGAACSAACCDCWTYRVGPCAGGVEMGDQLSVSRFLLRRLGEELSVDVCLAPRAPGPAAAPGAPPRCAARGAPGACCSVEFSTSGSRAAPGGVHEVHRLVSRLQAAHAAHAPGYAGAAGGPAAAAAAAAAPFSVAVGDARAAIVIPTSTLMARAGPFVDRRAAGDADPYLATALLTAGALGLPLPPLAARALAARAGGGAAAAAGSAAEAAAAASRLLLERAPAGAAGLGLGHGAGAFSAAAAAAQQLLLHAAAVAAAAPPPPRPSGSHGACSPPRGAGDYGAGDCGAESEGEDSEDMLISEIRRIDREARRGARARARPRAAAPAGRHPAKAPRLSAAAAPGGGVCEDYGGGDLDEDYGDDEDSEDEEDDSACSAAASAAGSPRGLSLAGGAMALG